MGAEQSQGEKQSEPTSQDLTRQASAKARAAQEGSTKRIAAPAGQDAKRAALYQGQDLQQGSNWARLFEQAKEDEAREAAGEVIHAETGLGGPARHGSKISVNEKQREALERRHAAMAASSEAAAAGKKTFGVKVWERSGNKYEGEFLNGVYHGRGKLTYADGRTCEGNWVQGYIHGECLLLFRSNIFVSIRRRES